MNNSSNSSSKSKRKRGPRKAAAGSQNNANKWQIAYQDLKRQIANPDIGYQLGQFSDAYRNPGSKLSAPVSVGNIVRKSAPSLSGSAGNSFRVSNREFVRDIPGSVAFSVISYSINPGLPDFFSWASQVAFDYDEYVIEDLQIHFDTVKSTSTSGTVMMVIDYDAADAAPLNKHALLSYQGAVRSPVWSPCYVQGDKSMLKARGPLRLRHGTLAANLDVKTYDLGNLLIATEGCADGTTIGELYVSYSIRFLRPQSPIASVMNALSFSGNFSAGVALATPFGTGPTNGGTGGLLCSFSGATLTFNRTGQFLVSHKVTGTVLTGVNPTITGTATSTLYNPLVNGAATAGWYLLKVRISAIGQTVIYDYTAVATTITAGTVFISAFDYSNS